MTLKWVGYRDGAEGEELIAEGKRYINTGYTVDFFSSPYHQFHDYAEIWMTAKDLGCGPI